MPDINELYQQDGPVSLKSLAVALRDQATQHNTSFGGTDRQLVGRFLSGGGAKEYPKWQDALTNNSFQYVDDLKIDRAGINSLVDLHAKQNGVDPRLVHAVIDTESAYNPDAVSPKGATGLMQLMPETAKGLGVSDATDPEQNIAGGVKYLQQLQQKYGADKTKIIAAYNAGPGAVDKVNGIPNIPETQAYVNNVWNKYKALGWKPNEGNPQAMGAPVTQTPPVNIGPPTIKYPVYTQAPPDAGFLQKAKNLMSTGHTDKQVAGWQDVDISKPTTVGQGVASGVLAPAARMIEGARQGDPASIGSLALIAGGGGLVKALPLVGGFLSRGLAGYFSYDMLKAAYEKIPAIRQAIDKGDWPTAAMHITDAAQSGAFGAHAASESVAGTKLGDKIAGAFSGAGSFLGNESTIPKTAPPPSTAVRDTINKVINRPSVAKTAGAAQEGAETVSPEPVETTKPAAKVKAKAATPKTEPVPAPVAEPEISDEELTRITAAAKAANPDEVEQVNPPAPPATATATTVEYPYGRRKVNVTMPDAVTHAFFMVGDQKATPPAASLDILRQAYPGVGDDALQMQGRVYRQMLRPKAAEAKHGDTITAPAFKPSINVKPPVETVASAPVAAPAPRKVGKTTVVASTIKPAEVEAPTEDALDLIKKRELAKVVKQDASAVGLPEPGTLVTDNDTGEKLTYRGKSGNEHVFADDSGQVAMYDLSDKEFKNTFTPTPPKGAGEREPVIPGPVGETVGERAANDVLAQTILKPKGFNSYPVDIQVRDKADNTIQTFKAESAEDADTLHASVKEYVDQNADKVGAIKYLFQGGNGMSPISKYTGAKAGERGSFSNRPTEPPPGEDVKKKIADDDQPQMARTASGKVKLGADVKSLGEILGSSLYSRNPTQVITKELAQNAYDAIRGVPGGKVKVTSDGHEKWVEVSDNGKGMTADDLATVFTDLGSSGKRDQAEASGGFGLAKAAPLMMSDKLEIRTVSVDPETGQKMEHVLHTNKDALLGEGSEVQSTVVPKDTPTGTTVRSYLGENYNNYAAREYVRAASRSVNAPGKIEGYESWRSSDPIVASSTSMDIESSEAPKKIGDLKIHGKSDKIADVDVYASSKPLDMADELGSAMGAVGVEVNNNGIYQFDHSIYLGGDAKVAGLPKRIAVDVKSAVPEGHAEYPFSANRESLRDTVMEKVEKMIQEKFIEPAQKEYTKFLTEKYNSLPSISTEHGPMPIYDAGARLHPNEMAALTKNEEFTSLAGAIHKALNDTLAKIASAKSLEGGRLKELGSSIKRVGIILSPEVHGVYIPKPGTGKTDATIFVNPFSFAKETSPEEISSLVWHTIKHEILHDKIKGHYEEFTSAEATLSHALGRRHESQILETLDNAYADPSDPNSLREGVADALRIYNKSRGREPREKDIFGGEKLTDGSVQPAASSERSGDEGLPDRGTEAVPIEPASSKPVIPSSPGSVLGTPDMPLVTEVIKPGTQPPGEPLLAGPRTETPPGASPRRANQRGSFSFKRTPPPPAEPEKAPIFYSQLQRTIEQKMPNAASAEQVRAIVSNPSSGVKADELKWTGLDDLLAKGGKLTKQQVLDHLKENAIQVREVTKGTPSDTPRPTWDSVSGSNPSDAKYGAYQIAGGSNYKELLLTLPTDAGHKPLVGGWLNVPGDTSFHSTHWDEPNVLAHVRMNDRTTADGRKMLFLEELQSDMHQAGRKYGYQDPNAKDRIQKIDYRLRTLNNQATRLQDTGPTDIVAATHARWARDGAHGPRWKYFLTPEERTEYAQLADEKGKLSENQSRAVPAAPFSKTWHELAMKRMIRWASEHGYDKLGWATGEMQNDRYDLSKKIQSISYTDDGVLTAVDHKGDTVIRKQMAESDLPDAIGKEAAQKLLEQKPNRHYDDWQSYEDDPEAKSRTLSGLDLKIGGSGMRGFYDKILPEFASKYAKKWGAKAGEEMLPIPHKAGGSVDNKIHSIDISPEMRKSVLHEGQPISKLNAPPPRTEAPPQMETV